MCGREHRAYKSGPHSVLRTVLPRTPRGLVPQRLTRRWRSGPPAVIQAQLVVRRGLVTCPTKRIRRFRTNRPPKRNGDSQGWCAQHQGHRIKRRTCKRARNPHGATLGVSDVANPDPYRNRVNHCRGETRLSVAIHRKWRSGHDCDSNPHNFSGLQRSLSREVKRQRLGISLSF